VLAGDGALYSFGDAGFFGRPTSTTSGRYVSLSATPSGRGYWVFTDRGVVFAYGDGRLHDVAGRRPQETVGRSKRGAFGVVAGYGPDQPLSDTSATSTLGHHLREVRNQLVCSYEMESPSGRGRCHTRHSSSPRPLGPRGWRSESSERHSFALRRSLQNDCNGLGFDGASDGRQRPRHLWQRRD
jgi:hypothetical protein